MSFERPSVVIIALLASAVLGFLVWANWAELDQIARARGQVIPADRVQVLQSSEGGVIKEIYVREGDVVRQGELLMTLEKERASASAEESRANVAALAATVARLRAEIFDEPLRFPPEVDGYDEFIANQTQLYRRRRSALQEELSALGRQLELARRELELNEPLVDTGDVARAELIRLQREVADFQGQIVNVRNGYFEEAQGQMTEAEEELIAARQQLAQRNESLEDTDIVAPVDGVVKNVRLTTRGGVLRPGDEIMQIVPTEDNLIVEAKVTPADIAFVKEGQWASVKFDAYDSSIYGGAEGEVIYVSPDSITEQGSDGRDEIFYRVHLELDTGAMKPRPGEPIEIRPGMTTISEIRIGENTVLGYLTKPITKTLSEGMRER